MEQGTLTRRLAFHSSDIFEELEKYIIEKKRLAFALNLLGGLLEKNLPHYFLSDLPHHKRLLENRQALREKALLFLKKNARLLSSLLLDEGIEESLKSKLFYLLAKYLVKTDVSFKEILRFSLISLELSLRDELDNLPKQALCRYDLTPVAKELALELDCSDRPPYEDLLRRLREPVDPLARTFLLFTHEARIGYLGRHSRLPAFDEHLVKELLDSLPLKNQKALALALKKAAKRPVSDTEKEKNSFSMEKAQDITKSASVYIFPEKKD